MKKTTSAFKRAVESGSPVYTYANVTFYNNDGTSAGSVVLTPEDFRVNGNNYTQSGGSTFPLGVVLSKSVTLTINNLYNQWEGYDWNNTRINLESVVYPDGIDGRRLFVDEGMFYTYEVRYIQQAIEVVAYDFVETMDSKFLIRNTDGQGQIIYPTLWDYFVYLCDVELADRLGIDLSSFPVECHMYSKRIKQERFTNSDFVLSTIVPDNRANTTLRDAFKYVAQLAGGNIVVIYNPDPASNYKIDIIPYELEHTETELITGMTFGDTVNTVYDGGEFGETVTDTLTGDNISDFNYILLDKYITPPTMGYNDIVYTGVSITYPVVGQTDKNTTEYGTKDNMIEIDNVLCTLENNPSAADIARVTACAENIYNMICNKPIRPFTGVFSNNPIYEFMDNAIVIDSFGAAYNSFITEHTMNYLNGSDIKNSTPTPQKNRRVFFN